MLQRVCSVVDNSWRQSVVRTKTWRSEPCGLNVTISASCDWSVAIFTTSLESQESYLTLRNVTLQITRDFFHLHNTFARLYNAAASPASRLCSAGSSAIILILQIIHWADILSNDSCKCSTLLAVVDWQKGRTMGWSLLLTLLTLIDNELIN